MSAVYSQSKQLLDRARKILAGGVSSEFRKYGHPHALFYTHGIGSHIYDVDGNKYLDFTLSQGPLILGHSHPHVMNAVTSYSSEGQLFAGQHMREIELAEKLNSIIPCAELMRFCLDGSEAVQTAFRVARAKTKKTKFLRFEGHYHGWLDNVAWGISAPSLDSLGSKENPNVYPWSDGLPENSASEFIILPWNDADLLKKVIKERHSEIAAIITEPIMCNNGCIEPRDGFLSSIRELCDNYNMAFIMDEVITGFRLNLGGAQKQFNITPDLAIFGKAMASGYPISAVVGKKEWMSLIETAQVIHAGTMNSSNPTVAAAMATIEILEADNPYPRFYKLGKLLMKGIQEAAVNAGHKVLLQGPGPMFTIAFTEATEMSDYRDTFSADKKKLGEFIAGMHDRGIRVIGRGLWYISASHTENDIKVAIDASFEVLKEMNK